MTTDVFKGDLYARAVRHLVAPLWAWHENSPYLKQMKTIQAAQRRPLEVIRAEQWRRLQTLLRHAFTHVPFYTERMRLCGLRPEDIRDWDDLQQLPLLTKEDIRTHRERMVATNLSPSRLIAAKTSGSTGVSLQFVIDEESQQWKRAAAFCYDQWTGWQLGERVGAVWGNPKTRKGWRRVVRNALLERFTYLDTLRMDEAAMLRFYREIRRLRPPLLFGHAHSLYLFARYLRRLELDDIRPRGIISTAMVLHEFERREIEEVFGCPVTNRYGCEEVSLIACECRAHNGLHLNLDTLVIEFLRDGRPVAAGEPGAIVVTDLTNYGMPFIRYQVGDVGIPSRRSCSCGCSYPLMESLEGRTADYVVTPAGEYISGISLTENFAMCLAGVKQMQIVQERLDHILLRLVADPNASREEIVRQVAGLVRQRFGQAMRHEIAFLAAIPQEASGKYRFCISKVANPISGAEPSLERERLCL